MPGKLAPVDTVPVGVYSAAMQVASTAGRREPILEVRIGNGTFRALLDTGSSVSLLGPPAISAACSAGAKEKREMRTLRLASGWSRSTTSTRCQIKWDGGSRVQRFLCLSDLCQDVVLGRDFLTATGISLHIGLGGWTVGMEPQLVVPFAKADKKVTPEPLEGAYCLEWLFEHPSDTVMTCSTAVNSEQQSGVQGRFEALLEEYGALLTKSPGCTSLVEHSIDTGDSAPVRTKLRPVNPKKKGIMDSCLDEMLGAGLIRHSNSRWTSAPVLVGKKSGGYRVAIDYRSLNSRTKVPVYPMPRSDWLLAQLGNARWFTSFDLSQGFFQIPLREQDIEKTAFICHRGTFEFTRMPFGVAGGPATFQALMDRVLDGINHQCAMAFLDDVLVYSPTLEDHLVHVREVLERIKQAGLTINPDKVQLCTQSLTFLGHVISPGECRPDPEKVRAVADYPQPSNVKQLQAFLGLTGYYRNFIPQFSFLAKPLTNLLKREQKWQWASNEQRSFTALRTALATGAVLRLPDLNAPFIVETDASSTGIAAVLLQQQEDILRPVSFISRGLSDAERNYTVQEWECLAVVWAVDKFRPYLEFTEFEIHCDHSSLAWMFSTEQASPRVRRWVLRLQGFQCKIRHRRGKANIPADALSRAPVEASPDDVAEGLPETLFPLQLRSDEGSVRFADDCLATTIEDLTVVNSAEKLAQEQQNDPFLRDIGRTVQGECPQGDDAESRRLGDLASTSHIESSGLLVQSRGDRTVAWLPAHLRHLVLQMGHDHPTSAHAGFFKTLRRISDKYVWLGMRGDVSKYVRACQVCQRTKAIRQKPQGFMASQWPAAPMEELSVDLIGPLPTSPRRNKYLLVIIDKFTKFVELFPLRAATTQQIVSRMHEVFCRHGVPTAISSDNGKPFVSRLWKSLLRQWGISERHTVPYRPAGQMVERHNGTVKQCLRAYCNDHKGWDLHIPEIAFAMRTAVSAATGYTPALLCYGRELKTMWQPAEEKHDVEPAASAPHTFAAELQNHLAQVLDGARQHQQRAWNTQQHYYNRRRRATTLKEGDLVLRDVHVLSDAARGISSKLAPRRTGPFRIHQRLGAGTFKLTHPSTGRACGTAHVDQLLKYHPPWSAAASQFEGGAGCEEDIHP